MNATPAPRQILIALSLVALPLALAGCGNKGPLILPSKSIPVDPSTLPAPASEEPANAVPASDAEDVDGKNKGTTEPVQVPTQADETHG